MTTLNCREDLELADLLVELHPWAEMVRYSRAGGEAMAIAVRLGTGCHRAERRRLLRYHGWHDWYIAANIADTGAGRPFAAGLNPRASRSSFAGQRCRSATTTRRPGTDRRRTRKRPGSDRHGTGA